MLKKNKRKKKQASNKTSQTLNMYNSTRYASQETTGVLFFFGGGGGVALCFSTLVFWESLLTHKSTSPLRELSLLQMVMLLLGLSNYSNH